MSEALLAGGTASIVSMLANGGRSISYTTFISKLPTTATTYTCGAFTYALLFSTHDSYYVNSPFIEPFVILPNVTTEVEIYAMAYDEETGRCVIDNAFTMCYLKSTGSSITLRSISSSHRLESCRLFCFN